MSPCARFSASPVALPLYATALERIHQLVIEVKYASGFPQCPSTLSVSVALSVSFPLEFCFVVLKEGRKELESHSRVLFADGRMGWGVCVLVSGVL